MNTITNSKRSGRSILAAAAALLGFGITGQAQAALLYDDQFLLEPFPYTTDFPVAGQSGGSGTFFVNPWEGSPSNIVRFSPSLFPSLTMPGLIRPAAGVALPNLFRPCPDCIAERISRRFATPWTGPAAPEGTYYIGLLANFGSAVATSDIITYRALEMWAGPWPPLGFDPPSLSLGYAGFGDLNRPLAMTLRDSSGAGQAATKDVLRGTHVCHRRQDTRHRDEV